MYKISARRTLKALAHWGHFHCCNWKFVGQLLVITIPAILVYIATLNVFYGSGDMRDGGWLATLAWHGHLDLRGPPAFRTSFFHEHISPIFWLISVISYVLPLFKFDFFALFMAAIYALYASALYRLWLPPKIGGRALSQVCLAVLAAFAATFGAVGMQMLRIPHHEMLFPPLALWFFIMLAEQKYRSANLWFVLCLMVREDAGFHLFGILFLVLTAEKLFSIRLDQSKAILKYAFIALGYSVAALTVKSIIFPDSDVFQRNYIGYPPWQHVTPQFIAAQLQLYLWGRTYIYIPLMLTIIWAVLARNPFLPIGYIAFIPWVVISFFAERMTAASLAYYYAYPFWVSLAWPLVALKLRPTQRFSRFKQWPYILVLMTSLVAWDGVRFFLSPLFHNQFVGHPFIPSPGLIHRDATRKFVRYFIVNRKQFRSYKLGIDESVQALIINYVGRETWLADMPDVTLLPDILIYFVGGFEVPTGINPLLQTGKYEYFYVVPDSPIRLASMFDLQTRFPSPRAFVPTEDPKQFFFYPPAF